MAVSYDPNQPVSTSNYPPPAEQTRKAALITAVLILAALFVCAVGLSLLFTGVADYPPGAPDPGWSWSQVPDVGVRPSPYPAPSAGPR